MFTSRLSARPQHNGDERGVFDQIPAPEAPRLLQQAEQPLKAGTRNPSRCATNLAGHEIETSTEADRYGRAKAVGKAIDPELLFRSAERDEHQIGASSPKTLESVFGLVGGIRRHGRAVSPDDRDAILTGKPLYAFSAARPASQ